MTYSYNRGVDYSGHSQMIVKQLKVCFRFRGKLFGGTDPPNNTLFAGTVPPITHYLVEQFRQIAYSLEEHLILVWGLKIRIFVNYYLYENKVAQLCQWVAQLCQ